MNTMMYRGRLRAPVSVPGEGGITGSLASESGTDNGDAEATEYQRTYGLQHNAGTKPMPMLSGSPRSFLKMLAALCLSLSFCGDATRTPLPESPSGTVRPALAKSCRYLWGEQGEDGGWHSQTYALFRSGQALTPFILHGLLEATPETCPRPPHGVERALDFIRQHVNEEGVLGAEDDEILEYPNYSTSYALRCLIRAGDEGDRPLIGRMRAYLTGQQFAPESGFTSRSMAFGGWGFGGLRSPGAPGHMDLAHTRHVLQAISQSGVEEAALLSRAESFLRLVQRHPQESRPQPLPAGSRIPLDAEVPYDGGFYFSPVVLAANKGGFHSDDRSAYFRSYATATCEGLLALLAIGVPHHDERVQSARRWLEQHPRWDYSEGIPEGQAEGWRQALYFYHLAVRAEVYQSLSWPGAWRQELAAALLPQQEEGGAFSNRNNHLMKEDDPLLATALAVAALAKASR